MSLSILCFDFLSYLFSINYRYTSHTLGCTGSTTLLICRVLKTDITWKLKLIAIKNGS